jgi:ELWxxDGT repeat protein
MVEDSTGAGILRPVTMCTFNNKLYFANSDGTGNAQLWITDGTQAGTKFIKLFTGGSIDGYVISKNKVYFSIDSAPNGNQLWVTDGTAEGTNIIKHVTDSYPSTTIGNMTDVNGLVFFTVGNNYFFHTMVLWVSDGTEAGTHIVKDISPGSDISLVNGNGLLYMVANKVLLQSDGTTAGTKTVTDAGLSDVTLFGQLAVAGDELYVTGYSNAYGYEMYAGHANAVLPVTLLSFTGSLVKNDASLKWATTNEMQNNYFNVQRCAGNGTFSTIGRVNATRYLTGTHSYTYTDANVIALDANTIYYRLQQVDMDGKSAYSNVIKLSTGPVASIIISPNPARKTAYIYSNASVNNAFVTLTDMNGHILLSTKFNLQAGVRVPLNISTLAAGTYNVTIKTDGVIKQQTKLLIQ